MHSCFARNHIRLTLNKEDVKLKKTLPNEKIRTGSSCRKTAEARNVVITTEMLKNQDSLNVDYSDHPLLGKNAIFTGKSNF